MVNIRNNSLFSEAEPKPFPKHPYSAEELDDYCANCVYVRSKLKKEKVKAQSVIRNYMECLPAWVQVLLIENHVPIEVGATATAGLTKNAQGNASLAAYRIHLHKEIFDENHHKAEFVLSHEIGHIVDNMLGNHLALKSDGSMAARITDISPSWVGKMNRDIISKHGAKRQPANLATTRVLKNYGYSKASYPCESFAELMGHYLTEHFKGSDQQFLNQDPRVLRKSKWFADEAAIDTHMEMNFPHMWPHFRERMLPIAISISSDLYHRRRSREEEALQYHSSAMQDVIDKVLVKYGCPPLKDKKIGERLVKSSYNTHWQNLLQTLSEPLPSTDKERLRVLFPAVFEPTWGVVKEQYNMESFKEYKEAAVFFVQHVEDHLREHGLEEFIKNYYDLWEGFEHAIATREKQSSRRR